jgi:hypothetical protein
VLLAENLAFDRTDDGDLAFALTGDWKDYELWFAWRAEAACLQLCLSLDMRVDAKARPGVFELLATPCPCPRASARRSPRPRR